MKLGWWQCIRDWPDDGRPYVALGNLLTRMNKVQEARKVYEDGCQAVRGENAYIWQVLFFHLASVAVSELLAAFLLLLSLQIILFGQKKGRW
jgi:hypothetical protein